MEDLATIAVVVVLVVLYCLWNRHRFWTVLGGGTDLLQQDAAGAICKQRMLALAANGQMGKAFAVAFGAIAIPLDTLNKPVILIGLPDTGKTSFLNILIPSLMGLFALYPGRTRFVFLDVKNEIVARLHSIAPAHIPIHILNPLDARAVALDWPAMFKTRADLLQLAHSLCPPVAGDQSPFFRDCVRQLVWAVCHVLQIYSLMATRPWRLLDVLKICSTIKGLREVLALEDETRSLFRATLDSDSNASGDVISTLRTVVQGFVEIALAEADAEQRISLHTFLREDGMAVMGLPPKGTQAVIPLYSVFIRRLIEEAQTMSHPEDRLFLFLDEIALLDRTAVDSIVKASCVGRSHGIHIIAATQSLELLESALSTEKAHSFLASCATTVGFRSASKKTAEFIAGRFGNQEGIIKLHSVSSNKDGGSHTVSEQLQSRPVLMAEQLLTLPLADAIADELSLVSASPAFGNLKMTCSFVEQTRFVAAGDCPNVVPRIPGTASLAPLSQSELAELGLPQRKRS